MDISTRPYSFLPVQLTGGRVYGYLSIHIRGPLELPMDNVVNKNNSSYLSGVLFYSRLMKLSDGVFTGCGTNVDV